MDVEKMSTSVLVTRIKQHVRDVSRLLPNKALYELVLVHAGCLVDFRIAADRWEKGLESSSIQRYRCENEVKATINRGECTSGIDRRIHELYERWMDGWMDNETATSKFAQG